MSYSAQDFKKGQPRWCPGCGDHFFLASLHKAMAEIGVAPENVAVISGIGCSSRLPHYMATYGMNTIHGRAAAIATGAKIANPKLTVWQVSGDGDGLAIGGNHFIHANRRNIDLNMILLNNRIYGLTKGQYSPTSPRGFVSKSSPYGTVEDPFRPAELCFGARGHFFARCVATDAKGTVEVLQAAYKHKGASVTEVLQNCVIFNDHCHDIVYNNEGRKKNAIYVRHGEKLVFGENNEFGLVQQGFGLKVVEIGKDGFTLDDVLVHDAHREDNTLQLKLALMGPEDGFPIALGVIRDVEAPTYNDAVYAQLEEVSAQKKYHNFSELLETNDIWESYSHVICLSLVNDVSFKSNPDEFIHDYAIVNALHPERRIEGLRFVYVELPKFQPKTIAERKMAVLWLRFLTEISEHTKDAPAELLENELTEKALAIVEKSAMDEVQLYNYEKFWQAVINEEALIEGGYDEGLAKGMAKGEAKGRAEERKEMARKMRALGLSAELIMQTTGLSAEDTAEL